MIEIWKDVNGYEGYYQISNLGRLYSFPRERTKGGYHYGRKTNVGYLRFGFHKDGNCTEVLMHNLVWETFVCQIPKGYVVHHKNHNKKDNRLENLELLTREEHSKMHLEESMEKFIEGRGKKLSKTVLQYTMDGKFVAEYESTVDACKKTGINHSNISRCCNGIKHYKSAGGYLWRYK